VLEDSVTMRVEANDQFSILCNKKCNLYRLSNIVRIVISRVSTNLEIAKLPCVDFVMQGVQVLADQLMSQERDVQN
jgi:hypothetical protein